MHKNNENNLSNDSFDMNFQQIESTNNILSNIENKLNSFLSKKPAINVLKKKSSKTGFSLAEVNIPANPRQQPGGENKRPLKEPHSSQEMLEAKAAPRRLFNNELIAERITTKSSIKRISNQIYLDLSLWC